MPTCDSSNHYSGLLTMAKKVSKFFRIGVEGDTCDGRVISAQDIQEMAETFDPRVYG
ncbi:GPO family capsid scaffolding protein, partial [Escherichia coli]